MKTIIFDGIPVQVKDRPVPFLESSHKERRVKSKSEADAVRQWLAKQPNVYRAPKR